MQTKKNTRRTDSMICARGAWFPRSLFLLEETHAPICSCTEFPLLGLADIQSVSLDNHVYAQNVHHEHFSSDRPKNKINRWLLFGTTPPLFLLCDKSHLSFVCKAVFLLLKLESLSLCQIIQLRAVKRDPDSFISAAKAAVFQGAMECFRRNVHWDQHCGMGKVMEEVKELLPSQVAVQGRGKQWDVAFVGL